MTSRRLFVVAALGLAVAACTARTIVIASEDDLRRGLTISQVESILGPPVLKSGSTSSVGKLDLRYYSSARTGRVYEVTYWDGRVSEITWSEASLTEQNEKLQWGQTKQEVRGIVGEPQYVTGTEFETAWWYVISEQQIYLLVFRDGILTNGVQTDKYEILDALQE